MKISKMFRWLDLYFEEAVCVISLILLSVVMMLQIILRYIFQSPLPWAEEFCRYCFIYSSLFGVGYCIRNNKMLRVDLLVSLMPAFWGKLLDILGDIASLVFYVLFAYASWQTTMKLMSLHQLSPALQIPIWIVYLSGPVGFALAIIRIIQKFVLRLLPSQKKEVEL
ncbi:TRAP transporter small permease [Hominifimenecus sp. rT4P-3]|uniref:TRAP transporter small permease n=1 Tax=Hominifimenecus sp. rT4P-3 TaxID=3242979 RepID=UPI003DA49936